MKIENIWVFEISKIFFISGGRNDILRPKLFLKHAIILFQRINHFVFKLVEVIDEFEPQQVKFLTSFKYGLNIYL